MSYTHKLCYLCHKQRMKKSEFSLPTERKESDALLSSYRGILGYVTRWVLQFSLYLFISTSLQEPDKFCVSRHKGSQCPHHLPSWKGKLCKSLCTSHNLPSCKLIWICLLLAQDPKFHQNSFRKPSLSKHEDFFSLLSPNS